MRNNDVINNFMRGFEAVNSSKNLISYGKTLFNYNTKIAQHFGAITLVNGSKYSSTTSKHQNYIKNYGGLTIVLNKDDFFYITDMDYSEAYDLAYEIFEKSFTISRFNKQQMDVNVYVFYVKLMKKCPKYKPILFDKILNSEYLYLNDLEEIKKNYEEYLDKNKKSSIGDFGDFEI